MKTALHRAADRRGGPAPASAGRTAPASGLASASAPVSAPAPVSGLTQNSAPAPVSAPAGGAASLLTPPKTRAAAKTQLRRQAKRLAVSALAVLVLASLLTMTVSAEPIFTVDFGTDDGSGSFGLLDALLLVALLALFPSILVMVTSFLRIIIVLSFLRSAMGTQQSPPNQVLIGLALFLTLFIMRPVINEIREQAYDPYRAGTITQQQALERAEVPLKEFMLRQTYTEDINLFLSIANDGVGMELVETPTNEDLMALDLTIIVPAFATSELKRAFTAGFILCLPFLIIDMVVSSALMSMGMVMLPPATISLPFKIMLFVLVDGWGLLFSSLVASFR